MPSIACKLQVKLYGSDISIQFEISNKTLLFACTKIITFNTFDLFKKNYLFKQKMLIWVPLWKNGGVLCHVGVALVVNMYFVK